MYVKSTAFLKIHIIYNDSQTLTHLNTISPNKKLNSKKRDNKDKYLDVDKTEIFNSNKEELKICIPLVNSSEVDQELMYRLKKLGIKIKKKKNPKAQNKMRYDNAMVHTIKRHNKTNDSFELLSDFKGPLKNTHNDLAATSTHTDCVNVLLKSSLKKMKKKNRKSEMAVKDSVLSKETVKHKDTKKIEFFENNISEDHSKELYNDTAMTNTSSNSRNSKVVEEYPFLFHNLFKKNKKKQKRSNKDATHTEIISPKKSKKRKHKTDNKCSENNISQSVNEDKETYSGKGHVREDRKNNFKLFDAWDDIVSKYRTTDDTSHYFGKFCPKEFNNSNNLFKHENVHTGKPTHICDICFKTFTKKSHLCRHTRTHTGEKPYACNVCGRSFSRKVNLVMHGRTHTGEKPYSCNVCGRSFARKESLVKHGRTHTGEKPYSCNVCGRSFAQKEHLVVHGRTHTGEKPYSCNVCGRSFSEKGTLVGHNRTHTGERPYECCLCEKKFITKGNCTKHTRSVHYKCF
ncbi:zinc finger protein 37-like isoform X2 [Myzus persicae]|uniref:zinc finger protein 37-like isoform X2 n=1 Tax=Myzus persicae TaxID=13164 RepID=UPI000B9353A6|nr:zinc finger protein 37-like isoform X2 [Myzus persicae]